MIPIVAGYEFNNWPAFNCLLALFHDRLLLTRYSGVGLLVLIVGTELFTFLFADILNRCMAVIVVVVGCCVCRKRNKDNDYDTYVVDLQSIVLVPELRVLSFCMRILVRRHCRFSLNKYVVVVVMTLFRQIILKKITGQRASQTIYADDGATAGYAGVGGTQSYAGVGAGSSS